MQVLTLKDWKTTNARAKQMSCDLQMKVKPGKYLWSEELRLCYQAHETSTMTEMELDVYTKDTKNVKTPIGASMGSVCLTHQAGKSLSWNFLANSGRGSSPQKCISMIQTGLSGWYSRNWPWKFGFVKHHGGLGRNLAGSWEILSPHMIQIGSSGLIWAQHS